MTIPGGVVCRYRRGGAYMHDTWAKGCKKVETSLHEDSVTRGAGGGYVGKEDILCL